MKLYSELNAFYFLFVLLGIVLVGLAIVLFAYRSKKTEHQQENNDEDYTLVLDNGKVEITEEKELAVNKQVEEKADNKQELSEIELNKEKKVIASVQAESVIDKIENEDSQSQENMESTFDEEEWYEIKEEAPKEEDEIHEQVVSDEKPVQKEEETPNEEHNVNIVAEVEGSIDNGKMLERNAKRKLFQERYQLIIGKLEDRKKYTVAHKELMNKVGKLEKELEAFQQVIHSEENDKIVNQVVTIIERSLNEVEMDIKTVPVLLELSQTIIPRMIAEKSSEYEECKQAGIKLDKEILSHLQGATTTLTKILPSIKKMEIKGMLEELIAMAREIDAIDIEVSN